MRKMWFASGLLLLGSAAHSQSGQVRLLSPINPDGQMISCASALLPDNRFDQELRMWAFGYWSGRNSGSFATVGGHTDNNGIIAEMEKQFREKPSMLFVEAVGTTYNHFKMQGH